MQCVALKVPFYPKQMNFNLEMLYHFGCFMFHDSSEIKCNRDFCWTVTIIAYTLNPTINLTNIVNKRKCEKRNQHICWNNHANLACFYKSHALCFMRLVSQRDLPNNFNKARKATHMRLVMWWNAKTYNM